MSAVIVLSSSPARVFARSQTPIASPPSSIGDRSPDPHEKFGTIDGDRDSFSTKFVSARKVLGARSGAGNIPIRSPTRRQEKSPSKEVCYTPPIRGQIAATSVFDRLRTCNDTSPTQDVLQPVVVQIRPSDVRRSRKKQRGDTESLQLERALIRRKEWTPPKITVPMRVDDPESITSIGLGERLASFSHSNSDTSFERSSAKDGSLVKRRRLDLIHTKLEACTLNSQSAKAVKKRNKSPAKKPLTITELATSNYVGAKAEIETPMMQFLTSTQARTSSNDECGTLAPKVKRGTGKKTLPKSRLKSPTTVMRTIQQQEIIFASASQLAREESPSLLKDTIEAIKQSEELLSDHLPSQEIEILSVRSGTPKTGTSKFWGQRGLWAAGDRDENNALIHSNENVKLLPPQSVGLRYDGAGEEKSNDREETTFDIDDLVTPRTIRQAYPAITKRSYTMKSSPGPKTVIENVDAMDNVPVKSSKTRVRKSVTKPNYEGWTDEQLKKQVKAYGFKRIRARKRCIEVLEECWRSMNNAEAVAEPASEAGSEPGVALQHGAVLSNVHDLQARLTPKAKKPRVRKANPVKDTAKTKPKANRKKVEGHEKPAVKKPRGRSPRGQILSGETGNVVDVDDITSQTGVEAVEGQVLNPESADAAAEDSDTPLMSITRPSTRRRKQSLPAATTTTPQLDITGLPDLPNLKLQILPALLHTSKSRNDNEVSPTARRNYQKDPTWHQKILMYDPIVLEDFTAWLNTKGFNGIGEDREIDILEVRAWLEENSICCLWKGGWRGNGNGSGSRKERQKSPEPNKEQALEQDAV